MIAKAAFENFIAERGNIYPYNEIMQTRNGLYPKWILLSASRPQALFRMNGLHLVPTACVSNNVMQEMIVLEEGIPFPSEYDDVAHAMEYWGCMIDGGWQQQVLSLMDFYLKEGRKISKHKLYFDCIEMLINKKFTSIFIHHVVMVAAMEGFKQFFDRTFEKEPDYFKLAVTCIHYVDNLIAFNTPQSTPDVVVSD